MDSAIHKRRIQTCNTHHTVPEVKSQKSSPYVASLQLAKHEPLAFRILAMLCVHVLRRVSTHIRAFFHVALPLHVKDALFVK